MREHTSGVQYERRARISTPGEQGTARRLQDCGTARRLQDEFGDRARRSTRGVCGLPTDRAHAGWAPAATSVMQAVAICCASAALARLLSVRPGAKGKGGKRNFEIQFVPGGTFEFRDLKRCDLGICQHLNIFWEERACLRVLRKRSFVVNCGHLRSTRSLGHTLHETRYPMTCPASLYDVSVARNTP